MPDHCRSSQFSVQYILVPLLYYLLPLSLSLPLYLYYRIFPFKIAQTTRVCLVSHKKRPESLFKQASVLYISFVKCQPLHNKTRIFVTYMLAKKMAILWQYFGYHKITITFMLARQNGTILAILDSRYLYVGVVTFYVGKNTTNSITSYS